MLPGLMKLVEEDDEHEEQRAAEKEAERRAYGPSFGGVVWKIIKIALVVGIVLLLLKLVGFYLLMGIFGMA
jgi:flagellar basal body-associated protein FliL